MHPNSFKARKAELINLVKSGMTDPLELSEAMGLQKWAILNWMNKGKIPRIRLYRGDRKVWFVDADKIE